MTNERIMIEREFFLQKLEEAEFRNLMPGWVVSAFIEEFGHFPSSLWTEFCSELSKLKRTRGRR